MGLATFEIMKWQVPGLATFEFKKWQVQWDLPLLNGVETGWIRKFLGVASPLGLATPHSVTFQPVSRPPESGKSHGTCHFLNSKVASPMGLATSKTKSGKSQGTCPPHNSLSQPCLDTLRKGQVTRDLPLLKFKSGKNPRDLPLP